MSEQNISALGRLIAAHEGSRPDAAVLISPLRGGAIQENWLVRVDGHPVEYVLRTDSAATIRSSHSRAAEFAIVQTAHAAGVRTPRAVLFCDDSSVFGKPFALYEKIAGVALGPRIVRDMTLGGDRIALTKTLGHELAKIHRITPDHPALGFLGAHPDDPARAHIARLRNILDAMNIKRPALDWGLRWLQLHLPQAERISLVHSDFRTGNYLIDSTGLTAILDWEFAHWGDPHFDIAWFCAKCWRFGRNDLEAGGIGSREDFYAGYELESGAQINHEAVAAYEVLAHARWAVIALEQGERHISGSEPSLELALTGRIAAELEYEIIRMTPHDRWSRT